MTTGAARPLVTAVVPAHNAELFVAAAVDSVLAQSYPNIECIVVDDGSTDRTASIVERFADHVQLVHLERVGVSRARNVGVQLARGNYIAFLDADDVWKQHKVEILMEQFLLRPDLGLVYSALDIVDPALCLLRRLEAPEPSRALRNTFAMAGPAIQLISSIISRRAFDTAGGFDARLSTSADLDLVCRISRRFAIERVPDSLTLYRQHGDQMHHDVELMRHDMSLVLTKTFASSDLPESLRSLRGLAHANLHLSLAGEYLHRHRPTKFLTHLCQAAYYDPARTSLAVFDRLRGIRLSDAAPSGSPGQ
jgi:glycosyltransferase involved in cell wall biosynthesis